LPETRQGTLALVDGDIEEDFGEMSRGGRPIAPGDLPGRHTDHDAELAADLQARIAELDAIAWNLPAPRASSSTSRADEGVPDE
jgi:hypothetical protein